MSKELLHEEIDGILCIAYLGEDNIVECTVNGEEVEVGIALSEHEIEGEYELAVGCILKAAYNIYIANKMLESVYFD